MSITTPTGLERPVGWTADRLRIAAQDVRVRVTAAVRAHRRGAPLSPTDFDDICLALEEIDRRLDGVAAHPDGRHEAAEMWEASSAIGTSRDLVHLLLRDFRAAGPGR